MAQDQFTQNTDSPSFSYNISYASPELSRLPSSSSSGFSSVTWWDEPKFDFEQDRHHGFNDDNNNCMDFMNNITWEDGGADFDVFKYYENTSDFQDQDDTYFFQNIDLENNIIAVSDCRNDASEFPDKDKQIIEIDEDDPHQQREQSVVKTKRKGSKDLAAVFLEWLKANKDLISAEDLRKVKLKRSTIESSIERFGGGKQGMKRLLKLILEWVQNHHIPHEGNKCTKSLGEPSSSLHIRPNPDGKNCIVRSSSLSLQRPQHISLPHAGVSTTMAADGTAGFSSLVGNTNKSVIDFSNPYQPTDNHPWSPPKFAMPSPSKDARRTRMAKQKRVSQNHDDEYNNQNEHYHHATQLSRRSTGEECYISTSSAAAAVTKESEENPDNNQVYYWS